MNLDETIRQLGGRAIFAMAFDARGTVYSDDTVTFRVARALLRGTTGRGTHVVVKLEADDTYTVRLIRTTRLDALGWVVAEHVLVYGDNLRAVVESMTGLRLTLGTMRGAS